MSEIKGNVFQSDVGGKEGKEGYIGLLFGHLSRMSFALNNSELGSQSGNIYFNSLLIINHVPDAELRKSLSKKLKNRIDELKEQEYLFTWEVISDKENQKLIEYIERKYDIKWLNKAKFEKIDNNMTIKFTNLENNLFLRLNNDKNSVKIEINGEKIDNFFVKSENGKLNVYDKEKKTDSAAVTTASIEIVGDVMDHIDEMLGIEKKSKISIELDCYSCPFKKKVQDMEDIKEIPTHETEEIPEISEVTTLQEFMGEDKK